MDLIPSRGAVRSLVAAVIRPLGEEDIRRLASNASAPAPIPANKKLRAIHHQAARLLAEGRTGAEVAILTGMTPANIYRLHNHDPAFIELVGYYGDQIMSAKLDDAARLQAKLVDVAEIAVDEIRDRLEDDKKRAGTSTAELRKLAAMGLDRTVAPSKSAPPQLPPQITSFTLNMGAHAERIRAKHEPQVIEGEAQPAALPEASSGD